MKTPGPSFDLASLHTLVDSLPALIFANRPDGYLDFCNQRMLDFVGLPFEDLEGWKWGGVVHPDDVTPLTERWQASLASGEPFECEARVRRADGEYRWMLHREVAVRDGFGQVVRWYGSSVDIEEQKRAEFYLSEGQRLAHTGSWAFNAAGFDYWSPELFAIHGLAPDGRAPTTAEYMSLVHPDDREFMLHAIRQMFADHCSFDFTKRIVRPDGETRSVRFVGTPITHGGTFQGFVGSAVDLTEHEQFEQERQQLRRLEADLAHRNRVSMMGEMAASLAHEIKQPIAAATLDAMTCLRALADHRLDVPAAREAASRMVKAAARADEIIKRTTALYKKDTTRRERVEINAVIRGMAVLFQPEAAASSISIRTDLAEGPPDVIADRVQLQQVFMNLMLNAIEAMKGTPGALTITSQMREDGALLISVSDTGVGLPTDNPEQIFESFVSTKPQGTGMGLAIARSIVESHGGRLWAIGNNGPGATFLFTLPGDARARLE